jgi:2-polyprenyl-3-methyl-5-hydroxy-6-metoxy-1,4-benzoquinol methylase
MDPSLYQEMYEMESTHWWFSAKHAIVLSLLDRYLPRKSSSRLTVCDLGCGCGAMLSALKQAGYDAEGIDNNDNALRYCASRGVTTRKAILPELSGLEENSYDAVLMLDVLEHLADPKAGFTAALRLARPGGIVICTVPAFQWLWTQRDVFHHHNKRYNRRDLMETLLSADSVASVWVSYMNTFLFPLAFLERMANRWFELRKKPKDLHLVPRPINAVLSTIFSSERFFFVRRIRFPYGLSLVGVVQKSTPDQ